MRSALTPDERKLVDELHEQGYQPHEISVEITRDTRTVKHYLSIRARENVPEWERQEKEKLHKDDIRHRIGDLKKKLEFASPTDLWIPDDPETGKPATTVGGSWSLGGTIEWELKSSGSVIKLDEEFDPVIEHLHSSRRGTVLDGLDRWRRLGGKCVEACYRLRLWIEREAKEQTGLDVTPDTGQKGLVDGFCKSVFWSTFSSEEVAIEIEKLQNLVNAGVATRDNEAHLRELLSPYRQVSSRDDLLLLSYAGFNLAWVREHEMERVKGIHWRLIETCQNLSITIEIRQLTVHLRQIIDSLHRRLDHFAGLKILQGECHDCPSD